MREIGVHLHDEPGAALQRPIEAGEIGLPEAILRPAVQDLDDVELLRQSVGDLARSVGRAVVND